MLIPLISDDMLIAIKAGIASSFTLLAKTMSTWLVKLWVWSLVSRILFLLQTNNSFHPALLFL